MRLTVRALLDSALRPFAQVLLSRNLVTGGFVLAALCTFPRAAAAALVAVLVAHGVTLALGFGREAVRDGSYACAAVLTALAAITGPDGSSWALVIAGATLAVLFGAALTHLLARQALPALSLPFVAATWVVQLTARLTPHADGATPDHLAAIPVAWFDTSWLDIPAAVLYLHGTIAGLLVVAAIAWHSRIALLLAVAGILGAALAHASLRSGVDLGPTDLTAAFNAMLTAMAVGGVYFVPHPASILLAVLGGALASVVTYALMPLSGVLSLPLLSLPFAVTSLLVVTALRMRERDRNPSTALRTATSPEDALERHLMRVRRFGEFAWLPFRLPFRGTWTVTQGHDGAHTHQGPWRHAFDFEILGSDGRAWEGEGREPRDFRCYNLPVLAAGTGTVESVRDGVPDNPIGGMNARENWGNTVVIAHGSDLYSVYSHLKPGSINVKVGDPIRAGAELGRCGNSGRSLVPHLHFHVQRGPTLGSETLAADFGDVVSRTDRTVTISHRVIPAIGARVRPIMRDEALAGALAFPPGSRWLLTDPATDRQEPARVDVDLWGRRALRSARGALYLESYENALVIVAFDGAQDSLLRYLLLAMARVPFDQEGTIEWTDRVPRRLLFAWPWAFLDLLTVVAPGLNDWDVQYASRRSEGALAIAGRSASFRTSALVSLSGHAHRVSVTRGSTERVVLIAPQDNDPQAEVS